MEEESAICRVRRSVLVLRTLTLDLKLSIGNINIAPRLELEY